MKNSRKTFWLRLMGAMALLGVSAILQQSAQGGCSGVSNSDADPCGPGLDGSNSACDPAFAMTDPVTHAGLKQQLAQMGADFGAIKKSAELIKSEQKQYQAFAQAVKKNPAGAFGEASALWRGSASADLQRLVILNTLPLVKSTEQSQALEFMLRALSQPETERAECARLGRGNSLEKSIAAKRLTLLEENARLRSTTRN